MIIVILLDTFPPIRRDPSLLRRIHESILAFAVFVFSDENRGVITLGHYTSLYFGGFYEKL